MNENRIEGLLLELIGQVKQIDARLTRVESKLDQHEIRLTKLEQLTIQNNDMLTQLLGQHIPEMKASIDQLDAKIDDISDDIKLLKETYGRVYFDVEKLKRKLG